MALFDVILPVKDGAEHIAKAVESIQGQSVKDWRLLVLDHGSTDDTGFIVDRMRQSDPRIERHLLPNAKGLAGLLNAGLALVKAPYAMRMDADDECLPERMKLTKEAFERDASIVVVGGQACVIDNQGTVQGHMRNPCDREELARRVMFRNTFIHPAVSFRSQAVHDMKLAYGASIFQSSDPMATIQMPNLAEDYLLFGELAVQELAVNIPQEVLRYRVHAASISRRKHLDQLYRTLEISRHLGDLLGRRSGSPAFDPVPFCTHAQALVDVGSNLNYRAEYECMSDALRRAGGAWKNGNAELKWRETFVDRSIFGISIRAGLGFITAPDSWERQTVVYTIKNMLRQRERMNVAARI